MRLHTSEHEIERIGAAPEAEAEFTIKTTAKAFDILSSGLYTDPILAIIRELSCNAYDAHVEAGNADKPFLLCLPNRFEPDFIIRDYGTGLSHENVMKLYTTYFESTKTDSNDFIGALGLGSKSPFAYASSFKVTSWFDGVKSLYTVFLNESGIPSIKRDSFEDSNEPNGLEIKLHVKEGDYYSFESRTRDILKYFPVKPTVQGVANFEFNQLPDNTIKSDGWFVAPYDWGSNRFTAVQGNVPYRVDLGQIRSMLSDSEREFFDAAQIVAFFDIGQLDVAANREEIRYDDRTKENLVKMARKIRSELTEAIEADLTDIKRSHLWEAYKQLDDYSRRTLGGNGRLAQFVTGTKITDTVLKKYVESGGRVTCKQEDLEHWEISAHTPGRYSRFNLGRSGNNTAQLKPSSNYIFVVNDVQKGGVKRTANYVFDLKGTISTVIMIRPDDFKDNSKEKANELKKIISRYGNPEVVRASDMDDVSAARTSGGKRVTTLFKFDSHYSSVGQYRYRWSSVAMTGKNAPKEGLYFFLARGKTAYMGETTDSAKMINSCDFKPQEFKTSVTRLLQLINKVKGTSYTFDDVYGAPVTTMKALQKDPKWHNIFDVAREVLPTFVDDINAYRTWEHTDNELDIKTLIKNDDFVNRVNQLDDDSQFRQIVEPIIEGYDPEAIARAKEAAFFTEFFREWYDQSEHKIEPLYETGAFNVYPMLTFVGSLHYTPFNADRFFEYIQLVDRS